MAARVATLGFVAALMTLGAAAPATAAEVPPLRGRVNDGAAILDPAYAAALEAKLARYEQETGHQLALLTVRSLEDEPIESFAVKAFEAWKLGDARRDDGLLLVVAPAERTVRIEVGYGLEGAIPDAIAARVIRERIVPAFRAGDYAGGIDRAFDALMAAGRGEAIGPPVAGGERQKVGTGAQVVVFWVFLVLFSMFGRRRRRHGWFTGAPGGFFIGGGGFGGGGGGGGGGFHGGGGGSGGGGASGNW